MPKGFVGERAFVREHERARLMANCVSDLVIQVGGLSEGRMSELARRAWVVSVGLRQKDGVFFEYLLFYAGHPTKQSAVDAVRRHLMHRASPRIKTERELLAAEIVTKEVRYRQVRFFGKRRIKLGASNCEGS